MTHSIANTVVCCAVVAACSTQDRVDSPELFGLGAMCSTTCTIDGEPWVAPEYTEMDIGRIEAADLTTPFEMLSADPYQVASPPQPTDEVCALRLLDNERTVYTLETFPNATAVETVDGAKVTHRGACGLCSPLQDLAVYLRNSDLTTPVRECAMQGILNPEEDTQVCLQQIGFTPACAQIWAFNAQHTRRECFDVCLQLIDAPFNDPDGSLNACLACDEEKSGLVFQAVAGRTRRNSGIPSAICRFCEGVEPIDHRYWL